MIKVIRYGNKRQPKAVEQFTIDGRTVYAPEFNPRYRGVPRPVYGENGEPLIGKFLYGTMGKRLHKEHLKVNPKNELIRTSSGWQGASGRGWGGRLVSINFC